VLTSTIANEKRRVRGISGMAGEEYLSRTTS